MSDNQKDEKDEKVKDDKKSCDELGSETQGGTGQGDPPPDGD